MARLFFDARNITATPAGVGRYAQALIGELAELCDHELVAIRHDSNTDPIHPAVTDLFVPNTIGNARDYLTGGRVYRSVFNAHGRPDLVHNLFHVTPRGVDVPTVVTLHDTIWIDHARESQATLVDAIAIKQFASRAIPDSLRRAEHVIAVSQATAERATEWIDESDVTAIPHGVSAEFFEPVTDSDPIVDRLTEDNGRFIFAVGNDKPYKNLHRLIRAFEEVAKDLPGLRLAIAGSTDRLNEQIAASKYRRRIFPLGFLDDSDLRRVMQRASVFVFPSLIEGFGLPMLEAMASGTPVIASDLEPMRSVIGDAGVPCDPFDLYAMAIAIRTVLTDDELHSELVRRGRQHAKRHTWKRSAERTLEIYNRILGTR